MNERHLIGCASDEWAGTLAKHVIPWALEDVDVGSNALEIGPGPGRTTDILREIVPRLVAVEIDGRLLEGLARRFAGSTVSVIHSDATRLPFTGGSFSAALSFHMLHHVPSSEMQDAVFEEAARVLRHGGNFVGVDSLDSADFREFHVGDVCVPLPPESLEDRLRRAGFRAVEVDTNPHAVRFRARV